jgi:hypothetical protein
MSAQGDWEASRLVEVVIHVKGEHLWPNNSMQRMALRAAADAERYAKNEKERNEYLWGERNRKMERGL